MNTQNILTKQDTLQFISDIKQSSFLEIVCEPIEECVFAFVTGSRLSGLATPTSDIDITVILSDSSATFRYTGRTLKYHIDENRYLPVQWFPKSVEQFFATPGKWMQPAALECMGLMLFEYIDEEFIFYKNEKYKYIFDNFLKHKDRIVHFGIYKLYDIHKNLLNTTLKNISSNKKIEKPKTIARLCYAAEKADTSREVNLEQIKKIKRSNNPDIDFIKDRLLYLQQYVLDNPIDIKKEEKELIQLMYSHPAEN